ncbi:MAG: metallophosphoesterase [Thermodesulfobacteriota bacterium]|nr:metallophosphoesterase [Thermodesulfobacteriota bacterium]
MKFTFVTDIHGNVTALFDLFGLAEELSVDAIVFGGDILPEPASVNTFTSRHREFINSVLGPVCENFKSRNSAEIYLMLGNYDASGCAGDLQSLERAGLCKYLHMRLHDFGTCFIYGYSFIPLTHFGIKDWEKFDDPDQQSPETAISPFVTGEGGAVAVDVEKDIRPRGTIEEDFVKILSETTPAKTIYVTHTPPYNTALDIIHSGEHVGSRAIRKFIDGAQPPLTLHGHIHESPSRSGKTFDILGNTISVNPGDSRGKLNAVLIDTEDIVGSMKMIQ